MNDGPGSPMHRLAHLLSELAIRFPDAHDSLSARAPEPDYLDAIDKLKEVVELAHKHRVTVMLALHDVRDMLSEKQTREICVTDEALQKAIIRVRNKIPNQKDGPCAT